MEFDASYTPVITGFLLVLLYAFLFLVGKWLKDLLTPYSLDEQLTDVDNPAISASLAGYFIGLTAVFVAAVDGPHVGLKEDLLSVLLYTLAGLVFLNVSRVVNERLILHHFSVTHHVLKKRSVAAGVVQGASYVASGLIIAGAIHGEGGNPLISLAFYGIGQFILVIFGLMYEKITPYSVHKELESNNLAAGLGFAGGLIAIGIILMKAISGVFVSWGESLEIVAAESALVLFYLFFVRLFFDKLIIPKSDLNKEIWTDRNVGAGLLEFTASICFAIVLFFTL